jgi:hypothetical protein
MNNFSVLSALASWALDAATWSQLSDRRAPVALNPAPEKLI